MVLNSRLKVIQRYMFLFCYGFSFSKHMYNIHWLVQILMFWNRIYGKPQFYNNSIHNFSETSYLCSLFFPLQWQPLYNIRSLRSAIDIISRCIAYLFPTEIRTVCTALQRGNLCGTGSTGSLKVIQIARCIESSLKFSRANLRNILVLSRFHS